MDSRPRCGKVGRNDPLEQIAWTVEKNANTNDHYVNVVKAAKWWRAYKCDGKYPKGYPLEHLIGQNCPDNIGSVAEGFACPWSGSSTTITPTASTERAPLSRITAFLRTTSSHVSLLSSSPCSTTPFSWPRPKRAPR